MAGSVLRARLAARRAYDEARERFTTVVLLALLAAVGILGEAAGYSAFPPTLAFAVIILGALVLRRRSMQIVIAGAAVLFAVSLAVHGFTEIRAANLINLAVISAVAHALASNRERLGVPGLRGDAMLLELRDRLNVQGEIPPLGPGWHAETQLVSAGGAGFGGDFLVAARHDAGRRLELALVDVSGKGFDAGTRALMLSGALGGLLGAVPPEDFLAAANAYIRRQDWDEGFATAVHVAIDLDTGDYLLESAGHPPAAQFRAGSGVWQLSEAEGTILGPLEKGEWGSERGRLNRGDALLLFTDGLVEVPGRDLGTGIDKLLGEANRLVVSTFVGGADRLVNAVGPPTEDDIALVLLWRS